MVEIGDVDVNCYYHVQVGRVIVCYKIYIWQRYGQWCIALHCTLGS